MLVADYYKITDRHSDNGAVIFNIDINPGCRVYEGHFPGEPVCPGVCNIQMLKECAEEIIGRKLVMGELKQCKLTTLMTPVLHPKVNVKMEITGENAPYSFKALLYHENTTFMEMKGTLSEEPELK